MWKSVRRAALFLSLLAAGAACVRPATRARRAALDVLGRAAVGTGGDPSASLIYAARTSAGIVVVDLGWWHAERALRRALTPLGGAPSDVVAVFLTHAHRDHVGAWRAVRHAPLYLGEGEVDRLFGATRARAWIPRLADRLRHPALPRRDEITVRTIGRDTAVVVGADTVRAFLVPGHTPGSVAYLVRGTLFVGDALSASGAGLRDARRGYSDDVRAARSSVRRLYEAAAPYRPARVCTAHARCEAWTDALWHRLGATIVRPIDQPR